MRNDEGQVVGASFDLTKASNSQPSFYWLPTLRAKTASIRLPLSRGGGQQLLSALLADQPDSRHAGFLSLLNGEPGLVLWTIVSRDASDRLEAGSIADLAAWLSERGAAIFDGLSIECTVATDEVEKDWISLTVDSLAASHWALRIADVRRPDSANTPRLLGLLVRAAEWLSASRDEIASLLPKWLTTALDDVRARSARRHATPAGCVAEAVAILSSKAPIDLSPDQLSTSELEIAALTEETRERWTAAGGEPIVLSEIIARLARLQRLESDFQRQLEFEKIESLKELAYGAGHEINNPLANISARAQTLLKEESDPEKRRKLAAIKTQAVRAHEMIADMMLFARPPELQLEKLYAGELLSALVSEFNERATEQDTSLVFNQPSEVIAIVADHTQLSVAIRALVANALEALGHGGQIVLSVQSGKFETSSVVGETPRNAVEISVTDNGPGISPASREHLFDPYYSGREANRGIGFGLCKCWQIVSAHGGRVVVQSDLGKGARFGLIFPAADC